MWLSNSEIQALQPKDKLYKAFLGQGSYLHVSPTPSKTVVLRRFLAARPTSQKAARQC